MSPVGVALAAYGGGRTPVVRVGLALMCLVALPLWERAPCLSGGGRVDHRFADTIVIEQEVCRYAHCADVAVFEDELVFCAQSEAEVRYWVDALCFAVVSAQDPARVGYLFS